MDRLKQTEVVTDKLHDYSKGHTSIGTDAAIRIISMNVVIEFSCLRLQIRQNHIRAADEVSTRQKRYFGRLGTSFVAMLKPATRIASLKI